MLLHFLASKKRPKLACVREALKFSLKSVLQGLKKCEKSLLSLLLLSLLLLSLLFLSLLLLSLLLLSLLLLSLLSVVINSEIVVKGNEERNNIFV